jgi:hypothetical protein
MAMNAADHSTLVFLLKAIEAAPAKSADLLALAAQRQPASEAFQTAVNDLKTFAGDEKALIAKSEELRRQLR